MKCPSCGSFQHKVINTIQKEEYIYRRRVCSACKFRFDTGEFHHEESTGTRVEITCKMCGAKVQTKTRRREFCSDCAKIIQKGSSKNRYIPSYKAEPRDPHESHLDERIEEAGREKLSYGKLQAKKFLETIPSVLDDIK